jgi:fermentation-respiration switch protein FrsA (DUF1100 family)
MTTAGLVFLSAAIFYVVLLVVVASLQRALLYFPRAGTLSPSDAGLASAQALEVETADGETLVAWHIPAAAGKPLLLYFHGNGGSLVERVPRFAALTRDGNGLLAISYRGYFGSTGRPTEAGLHRDADAAYRKATDLGYDASKIVTIGESLGTGVAVALAARKPFAAVILDSPYTSTIDVAAAAYWMFPVRRVMWDRFHSDRLIDKIRVPLLITHGTIDRIIPLRFATRLFDLANEPKIFIEVPRAGHLVLGLPDVMPKVLQWLEALRIETRL